jgi:hypothetical protein
MEVLMNILSSEFDNWAARVWRILTVWEEAFNTSPIEQLERRVAALEQHARLASERPGIRAEAESGWEDMSVISQDRQVTQSM